jgi:hypothetical protein
MGRQSLVQYVFADGSEIITNSEGKALMISETGKDYLPLQFKFGRYVQGSAPNTNSYKGFSKRPKVGQHLVTATRRLLFFPIIYTPPIKEINMDFQLSS